MTKTIPATEARKSFFKLIEETDQPGRSVTITVGGKPRVVMMSAEDFEGWLETLEIMSDEKLMKTIRQRTKSLEHEKLYSADEVEKMLQKK
ncbi:MAG: hypothetical protein A2V81_02810 [Candidatus Abawacabacteria bacterium RBG_16_42_10]|uniref:Antitoxin n=1 Tax=Candidatus Abawacabacteria bacterium RBG_16_42_10 TaxID=1817814 RepID=A0A1F4XK90_9BACT|nr:MAG: hypothetical protein A2V81_02810 [Candidatus Abawacabacteria bacterium RBG_16_42_10]